MLPEDTFKTYGGHEGAVGVTVGENEPTGINEVFNEGAREFYALNGYPTSQSCYDAELKVSSVSSETAQMLSENLYPYSFENPDPVYMYTGVTIFDSELRENENWSSLTFSLQKGDDVSELKVHVFNPEFGSEVDGKKANVYFSFPQDFKEGKYGFPNLVLKDIQFIS